MALGNRKELRKMAVSPPDSETHDCDWLWPSEGGYYKQPENY